MEKSVKIELFSQPNKVGISMIKSEYYRIANFIFATLESQEHKRIKINVLLDIAKNELDKEYYGNVSWYLLQVKNDMVARGLINIVFTHQREQMILKGTSRNLKHQRRNQFFTQDILYTS